MRQFDKVIVTGGAGFIGSELTKFLLQNDVSVKVIDDLSKGKRGNLPEESKNFGFIKADLRDRANAINYVKDADWVFHLASQAYGVAYCSKQHNDVYLLNSQINSNVIEAAVKNNIKGILAVSSSCVYSDSTADGMEEEYGFIGEPETANWGYGWAKRMLEIGVQAAIRDGKLEGIIVRPVNVYGETYGWYGEYSHVIPSLIKKILDGENPLTIWGDGTQARNFIHTEDIVRAFYQLALKAPNGTVVNIGSQELVSINDIVNIIKSNMGFQFDVRYDTNKPTGRKVKSVSNKLFYKLIPDFNYSVPFSEGLLRMKKWYERIFVKGAVTSNG